MGKARRWGEGKKMKEPVREPWKLLPGLPDANGRRTREAQGR